MRAHAVTGRLEGLLSFRLLLAAGGVASVAMGVLMLVDAEAGLATLSVIAGVLVLVDGIGELFTSIGGAEQTRTASMLVSIVSAVVGVLLIRHPVHAVAAAAIPIGLWLIIAGMVHIVWWFDARRNRAWIALVAFTEVVAGIVVVASPKIDTDTLALLVGLSFLVRGLVLCLVAFMLGAHKRAEAPAASDPISST
ncbi:MAG: DUF308 domain-containing protein [Solirubrobacterales bacterium]|nr:DUF308 domain-containing protein [Solirubrobacterales bacterium]